MGISGDIDPALAVSIDRIIRNQSRRGPLDKNPISLIAPDRVPHYAGGRGKHHFDPIRSIILNDVRARGLVSEAKKSNPSSRGGCDRNSLTLVVSYRVTRDYSERSICDRNPAKSITLDRVIRDPTGGAGINGDPEPRTLYRVTVYDCITTPRYGYSVVAARDCKPFYDDASSSHYNGRSASICALDRCFSLTIQGDSSDFLIYDQVLLAGPAHQKGVSWLNFFYGSLKASRRTIDGCCSCSSCSWKKPEDRPKN